MLALIGHARSHGRQAYYVESLGFDDLLTRLALHCLPEEARNAAAKFLEESANNDLLVRRPFNVRSLSTSTLIKSNMFPIECPSEVLQFEIEHWPASDVWPALRSATGQRQAVAAPFRGKGTCQPGTIDDIQNSFQGNIKGLIERAPVAPTEFGYDHGAIVSLMREALTRAMAEAAGVHSDGRRELWEPKRQTTATYEGAEFDVFLSVQLFLRRIGGAQYLVLKPSVKVLDQAGNGASTEVSDAIKLALLESQHNREFNQAVNRWRTLLFRSARETVFEFPANCGSTFRFKVHRSPIFGQIGLPQGGPPIKVPSSLQPLLRHQGIQLSEPRLVFSNRAGTSTVKGTHPIRGVVDSCDMTIPLLSAVY